VTVEMIQNRIDEFKDLWSNAINPGDQNRAYRLLVERIVYDRKENGVTLEILYKLVRVSKIKTPAKFVLIWQAFLF